VTKMVRLTVRFPADDALHVTQIRDHLRDALEERGIEALQVIEELNGEPLLADAPRKGRIYWPAAEVVVAVDRAPPQPAKPTKRVQRPAQED